MSSDNTNTPPTSGNGNTMAGKATGAAKFFTSAVGNTIGGVSRTAGTVTGAATKGLGDTISNVTGETGKPVGDAIGSLGSGLNNGMGSLAKGAENAGKWNFGQTVETNTESTK